MEYTGKLKAFGTGVPEKETGELTEKLRELSLHNRNAEVYRFCMGCLDLTSLEVSDTQRTVGEFTAKAIGLRQEFQDIPMPASVCVFPNLVDAAGIAAGDSGLRITAVAGGFPTGQTYLEVKMLEAAMAVENGADEIDTVMNVGAVLSGSYEEAANEIEILRGEVGEDVTLKAILETGMLPSHEAIRKASLLAMLAGADFIKTSTGKTAVSATPEAAVEMCRAIGDFRKHTGKMVGFKAAGGVRTAEQAALYYTIVENILGREWLAPQFFRIGASSLANSLLSAIYGRQVSYF